jgi:IS4 transposase
LRARRQRGANFRRAVLAETRRAPAPRFAVQELGKPGGLTYARKDYPLHLRRVRFSGPETGKKLVFLTNNFALPATTIAALYKKRWQVELFFKWINQNLRIKHFFGTSENAVKTQIWIAVCVYVLAAIIKKELKLDVSLYTFLQILSVWPFEKVELLQALQKADYDSLPLCPANQLNLFDS